MRVGQEESKKDEEEGVEVLYERNGATWRHEEEAGESRTGRKQGQLPIQSSKKYVPRSRGMVGDDTRDKTGELGQCGLQVVR